MPKVEPILKLSRDEAQKKINDLKEKLGVKCICNDSSCNKCLSVNCKDKNCPIHTKELKQSWRKRWERNNNKPFPHPKNY